jgi:hypothetical protein
MSNNAVNNSLRLYSDKYNDEGYASVDHISKGLATEAEWLAPAVTHLYYSSKEFGSKNFPMMFLTQGMGKTRSISSADLSYKVHIIGKPKKTSTIATQLYTAGDTPGKGGTKFTMVFSDRWFSKSQILNSGDRRVQVRVQTDPIKKGDYWYYEVVLMTNSKATSCPISYLNSGVKWARGVHKVGIEDSVGVEHRSYSPGAMFNQLSVVRDTYKIKGNVEEKIMVFEIQADGRKMKYWCEWELFLKGLEWNEKCEDDLWNSRLNRDALGETLTRDEDSNAVVPSGAGIIEQIPNKDTYSVLTTNKLKQVVRDATFNASDSNSKRIEVFTGTGGLEEASNAMQSAASSLNFVDNSDKFIEGKGADLVFGSYFKTFRHIDGHVITFRHLPMLDNGGIAQASEVHPESGLPLDSYNMYFLDMSTYDGLPNITYVNEKGRENEEFVVAGAKVPKNYGNTPFRATSRDSSTVEWIKTQGIGIRRPTNCFELTCNIS